MFAIINSDLLVSIYTKYHRQYNVDGINNMPRLQQNMHVEKVGRPIFKKPLMHPGADFVDIFY
jgi:hypothetical protein